MFFGSAFSGLLFASVCREFGNSCCIEASYEYTVCRPCRVLASGVVTENRASTFSRRHNKAWGKTAAKCLTVSPLNRAQETSVWSSTFPLLHRDQGVTDAEDEDYNSNPIFTRQLLMETLCGHPFVPTLFCGFASAYSGISAGSIANSSYNREQDKLKFL